MTIQEDRSDRRVSPKIPLKLPMGYWETEDSCQGGLMGNLSEEGMVIYSIQDMPIGTELRIKVFFRGGSDFDQFRVIGRIVSKGLDSQNGSDGFAYMLTFVSPSLEGWGKLRAVLQNHILQDGLQKLWETAH